MQKINSVSIRKFLYHLKHRYATMNNIVIGLALIIAASWAWGSISMMQRNFGLQKEVDARQRELELTELEVATLEYQQNYYQSDEYKDLAAREKLGLAGPGEKVLMLPPNTESAKKDNDTPALTQPKRVPSNFEQWMNFLSGKSASDINK